MVICLERGADLHMAQLMPLPLTVSCSNKIQIGFTFWYWLTWVVPEKEPLNGCVCVCVCVFYRHLANVVQLRSPGGAVTYDVCNRILHYMTYFISATQSTHTK